MANQLTIWTRLLLKSNLGSMGQAWDSLCHSCVIRIIKIFNTLCFEWGEKKDKVSEQNFIKKK